MKTTRTDRLRRTLLRFLRAAPLPAGIAALCLFGVIPAAAESASVSTLAGELRATVDDRAGVTFWTEAWSADRALLTVTPPWTPPTRRLLARGDDVVLRLTHEGAPGGHRGFSRMADDDGDGRIDEDRLDGVDNDGDGKVDEDFAAVGDAMHVVHRIVDDHARRLETYHWDYEHLRETLILHWTREEDGAADAVLRLPEGAWHEARIGWHDPRRPGVDPADRAMAAALLVDDEGEWWIGVTVLGGDELLRLDGPDLRFAVDGSARIAVSVTRTLTQLRCRQATAHVLYEGARAAPDADPVPWIVPPPVRPSGAESPSARLFFDDAGAAVLEIAAPEGWPLLPDPETVRIEGADPGPPTAVAWTDGERDWSAPWSARGPLVQRLRSVHPYMDSERGTVPTVDGTWSLTFPAAALPIDDATVTLSTVCGHDLSMTAIRPPEPAAAPEPKDPADDDSDRRPSLAPHLLEQYPNPFTDHLQVTFRVPRTVGEGFVWDEDEEPLLAPEADIPYGSPTPRVTIRIYSVAGHEVATLFDEPCGPGTDTATWNGLDTQGRPVATGTYFCKLQIENWSVTKRVALIR